MFMSLRSFKLVLAGFILGVGLPIHIGMMGQMYVISWALIATWAVLLINKCAAEERHVLRWVEQKLDEMRGKVVEIRNATKDEGVQDEKE